MDRLLSNELDGNSLVRLSILRIAQTALIASKIRLTQPMGANLRFNFSSHLILQPDKCMFLFTRLIGGSARFSVGFAGHL